MSDPLTSTSRGRRIRTRDPALYSTLWLRSKAPRRPPNRTRWRSNKSCLPRQVLRTTRHCTRNYSGYKAQRERNGHSHYNTTRLIVTSSKGQRSDQWCGNIYSFWLQVKVPCLFLYHCWLLEKLAHCTYWALETEHLERKYLSGKDSHPQGQECLWSDSSFVNQFLCRKKASTSFRMWNSADNMKFRSAWISVMFSQI